MIGIAYMRSVKAYDAEFLFMFTRTTYKRLKQQVKMTLVHYNEYTLLTSLHIKTTLDYFDDYFLSKKKKK